MQIVEESNAVTLTAVRRNDDGDLEAPTSLDWRMDCLTTGETVLGWTSVTSPGAQEAIVVSGARNAIRDSSNPYEDKQVTFRFDNGLDTQHHERIVYRVRNLQGVG